MERREFPRVNANFDGLLGDPQSNLWSPFAWSPVRITTMSQAGFSFLSPEKLEVGDLYPFRVRLPNTDRYIRLYGLVAHQERRESPIHYNVGVMLMKLREDHAQMIEEFVATQGCVLS